MSQLNIIHLGKYYPPEYGGIESVTAALAEDQVARGHRVEVICFTRDATRTTTHNHAHINRFRVLASIASQPISFYYLLAAIRRARRADLVHLHAPNLLAALSSLFLPKRTKLLVHWHADIESKGLLGRIVRPLERWMLWRANSIVCTSRNYADFSHSLKSFQAKVIVIPIGIPDLQTPFTPKKIPDQIIDLQQGRQLILTVGRLVKYKGLSTLLHAMTRIRSNSFLAIVGVGPLHDTLAQEIKRLGLTETVLLLGRQDIQTLNWLYFESAVFCLPSLNRAEAFGVVLLEAMRAKLPIVATQIPGSGVPWVNKHNISGLNVPFGDPEKLACALDEILNDQSLRNTYARKGHQRFEKCFREKNMCGAFNKLYFELIER